MSSRNAPRGALRDDTKNGCVADYKIVDLEDFALPAAILGECQNYLGGGVRFGRKREKYLPLPAAINLDALLA